MKKLVSLVILLFLMIPSGVVALTVSFSSTKVCLGEATTLINRSLASPGDSIQDIGWDLNGDGKFDEEKGMDTVNLTLAFAGSHEIGLKVITYGGEVKAKYQLVYVASIAAGFSFTMGCASKPIPFKNETTVKGDMVAAFRWDFGDGTLPSTETNPLHQYSLPGTYVVWLVTTSLAGCQDSIPHQVIIGEAVVVNLVFSGDTVFVKGDSVTAYLSTPYDSVKWSSGATTNSIVIKKGGYYWVRVYERGCYADKSFSVTVDEYGSDPVIMNLITPNGDGMNDLWMILNLNKTKPCEVEIYSRYGDKVLSDPDYKNDWDGSFRGKSLPNDTYYYFVRCLNKELLKGTVNILK